MVEGAGGHGPTIAAALLPAVHCPLQLGLGHLRASLDTHLLRLVVELVAGATLLPAGSGAQAATPPRGDVLPREARRRLRLTRAGALLVHRPGGDLLGLVLGRPTLLEAVLDVLVLALALLAPGLRHHYLPRLACRDGPTRRGDGLFEG